METDINLMTHEAIQKPYPIFRAMRETRPVHWNPSIKGWFLTRYSDIRKILMDKDYSVEKMAPFAAHGHGEMQDKIAFLTDVLGGWMVFKDPPSHTRLRRVMQEVFLSREIEKLRESVHRISDTLLTKMEEKNQADGKVNLVWDYAFPLPAIVIGELCGVNASEAERLKYWADDISKFVLQGRNTPDKYDRSHSALVECVDFYRTLVNERRKHPQDDIISRMIESPNTDQPLTDDEIISTLVLLLFAGHETTTNLIASGMFNLLQNPDQLKLLQNDPSLIPGAVEEFLRMDGPAATLVRIALKPVEIDGQKIKAGDRLFLSLNASSHDPEKFDNPEELDVTREKCPHMAFGTGIHVCLGAALARLEGQVAFRMLLERFHNFKMLDSEPEWRDELIARGLKTLPISFEVRS